VFSSKEIEIWTCKCEEENNDINLYYSKCENNIFGFNENEVKPNEILIIL
jgi:hypothetical protein